MNPPEEPIQDGAQGECFSPSHTALEWAEVIGCTPRALRKALRETVPTIPATLRGRSAAWSFDILPERLRQRVLAIRGRRGLKTVEDLFVSAPGTYTLPCPFSEIPAAGRERAEKWRDILSALLDGHHSGKMTRAEVQERGLLEHTRVFGYKISGNTFWRNWDRAVARDRGQHNWQRIDLYVDDAALRRAPAAPPETRQLHQPLDLLVRAFNKKKVKLPRDQGELMHEVFKHFEAIAEAQPDTVARRRKRSLLRYLLSVLPGISRNSKSMREWFNHQHRLWVARGRKPGIDGRSQNNGRPGYECAHCEPKVRGLASQLRGEKGQRGNVDLAIKLLLEKGELCPECATRRKTVPLTKNERRRMTPNAIEVASHKGSDAVRKVSPTHHCDSDTEPGDRFVIDDMTTNELAWDEVGGELISGQVQLLYTEDEASRYPLPFWMYFGAPNSITIKKALWDVFRIVGLPRIALVTERGVFNNRALSGEGKARDDIGLLSLRLAIEKEAGIREASQEEIDDLRERFELGLRDPALGLNIVQANSPQAKSVERTFFELQKRASILPGFSGFNQRFERSKALQDFERRVQAGKEHPGNEYLHIRELSRNYQAICEEFAHRGINGMQHRGRSPLQFWKESIDKRPLRHLPPEMEALFAARRLPGLKVHSTGIRVKLDRFTDGWYFGAATGPLVDRRVAVHIHYDIPEFIHIEHPDTGELLKVERCLTKRRTATPEEIAKASAARRAHISGARAVTGNVDNLLAGWVIRDEDYSPADKEKGGRIASDVAEWKAQRQDENTVLAEVRRCYEILGQAMPDRISDPETRLASLELQIKARGLKKENIENA